MDIVEVKNSAREKMKGFCALCPECNGVWCAGKVPGMGGTGSGESFQHTIKELKKIKVIMRTLHNVK
ncbi:MAG: alpha-hydroxy-acid oxidizing protein, partial [Fusobacteriaceae bacterium]|nr:alpha-hydroxy-acid oxidizing protein [Fusobacteriaceae bacterium]